MGFRKNIISFTQTRQKNMVNLPRPPGCEGVTLVPVTSVWYCSLPLRGLNTRNVNGPDTEFGLLSKMLLKHFTDLSCPNQCKNFKGNPTFYTARPLFLPNPQKTRSYPLRQVPSLAWDASISEIKSEAPY